MWTRAWTLKSNTFVLYVLAICLSCESNTANDSPAYPADAPTNMMHRLNKGKETRIRDVVELKTKLGVIVGLREPTLPPHHSNTHMYAFRGIPYAQAPVKHLRFAEPLDMTEEWPGRRLNATEFRPICPQFDTETQRVLGSEDCLYLNIYTPSIPGFKDTRNKLHPVFVFIHGGGYMRGSSSAHGGDKLLTRNIVVVTINYRLGALGYLTTEDSVLPGNYGFLDQVSALRWVQRNIVQFGGNPDNVTLGGFSAGGSSTHLHMMSPMSKDLFHQAILMSGTSLLPWAVRPSILPGTKLLAGKLGCSLKTSKDISSCLADKTMDQIVSAQASIYRYEFFPVWFTPTVDEGWRVNPIIPKMPEEMKSRPIPTIVSSVPCEGLLFAALVILMAEDPTNITKTYEEVARYTMSPWLYPETEEIMKDLAEAFYYDKNSRNHPGLLLEQLSELLTDHYFGHSVWDAASEIAHTGAPVYTYIVTHRTSDTPTWALPLYQKLEALGYDTPFLKEMVSHGDDVVRVFAFPYALENGSEEDEKVTQILLNMLANFIIYGSPQEDQSFGHLDDISEWKPIKPGTPVGYFNISVNPSMVYKPYRFKEQNFWRSLLPRTKTNKVYRQLRKPSEEL